MVLLFTISFPLFLVLMTSQTKQATGNTILEAWVHFLLFILYYGKWMNFDTAEKVLTK